MATGSDRQRKWLIVAHCFNMDGRAASQTITDRLPHLMGRGVRPVVLSAPTGIKDSRFPHYRVISPAPSGIRFELRHILKNTVRNGLLRSLLKAVTAILLFPFYVLEKIFIHLDSQWSWFLAAYKKGRTVIAEQNPELIYSTAGPPSTHLAAYLLHRMSGLPWLAEMHDPLIHETDTPKWQNYYFKRWLERTIAANASAVIYFTEKALAAARQRTPIKRGYVVRPGALPPGVGTVHYVKGDAVHFGYFGSLAEDRNLATCIRVLHQVLAENQAWRSRVRLDIYGGELDPVSRSALQSYPLAGVLVEHGRLEYDAVTGKSGRQQVIERMLCCDVLLLLHGQGKSFAEYIPSKVYEYLLTPRPVLGLTDPGSEVGMILAENGQVVVSEDDEKRLKEEIAALIRQWHEQELPDRQNPHPYTVAGAVDSLLEIADTVCRESD